MNKKKQIVRIYNLIVIALLAAGIIYVCSRFLHFGSVEYTDNAMVHRNLTPVNTRVQGFIKEIRFKEFQHVKKGDTLVVLEDAEYRLALAQAEANAKGRQSGSGAISASIGSATSNVNAAQANINAASAQVAEARVGMENTKKDYERFAALLDRGAVTQQQVDHARTQYEQARSRYEAAQARARQATASHAATQSARSGQQHQLGQSQASESVAEASVRLAKLNLSYTVITAPCDGYVGRKTIYEGQLMQPGQLLCSVIDDGEIWVTANYRESQMDEIRVGQTAEFTADAVPGVTYKGRVESISFATGMAYSHVPQDNSTGNFVKVEQRVPVRIVLTDDNKAEDVARLLDGLNVECTVDYSSDKK